MALKVSRNDRFGLVRPSVDAHTLGISSVEQILKDCGYRSVIADAQTCDAFGQPNSPLNANAITYWIRRHHIAFLAFSYRLDPNSGVDLFGSVLTQLRRLRMFAEQGGPLRGIYFAGLPATCEQVRKRFPEVAGVFSGDETPQEVLRIFRIDSNTIPRELSSGLSYDEDRLAFGRDLVRKGDYHGVRPADRSGSEGFGTSLDSLVRRMHHGIQAGLPPLMRAHVGPYLPDRKAAVSQFLDWTRQLAKSGYLDILSVGTSQLTQSRFGLDWDNLPNGGGVPINSRDEFAAVWQAARPMLVRTYAGTRNIPQLARMYEETIHIAWHALSLWWFSKIDGRGPYDVRENLHQHIETLKFIAATDKPFEPNIPHHFAFRGADDVTYVVSAVLAARAAKRLGVRCLVLQTMLNTPKYTWGVQDLAKARATLSLVRELEDDRFRVILQPRGGLDYFSPDLEKAKAQLAAVAALMDDIEPLDSGSPPVIHVVSYSEASHLADPNIVDESIKITRHAIDRYRLMRSRGEIDDMTVNPDVRERTAELFGEAQTVLNAIEKTVANPYTSDGLYAILAQGFLPVPYLWECLDEFREATRWKTRLIRGAVRAVDGTGRPISAIDRMKQVTAHHTANARSA